MADSYEVFEGKSFRMSSKISIQTRKKIKTDRGSMKDPLEVCNG